MNVVSERPPRTAEPLPLGLVDASTSPTSSSGPEERLASVARPASARSHTSTLLPVYRPRPPAAADAPPIWAAYPPSAPNDGLVPPRPFSERLADMLQFRCRPGARRGDGPDGENVAAATLGSVAVPLLSSTFTALLAYTYLAVDEKKEASRASFLRPASVGAAILSAALPLLVLYKASKSDGSTRELEKFAAFVAVAAALVVNFACIPVGFGVLQAAGHAQPLPYGQTASAAVKGAGTMDAILVVGGAIILSCGASSGGAGIGFGGIGFGGIGS